MNNKKQKLIIQNLLSSTDVFSRCNGIIKSTYFDPEFRPVVSFIQTYFKNYHALPSLEIVKTESEIEFSNIVISPDEYKYTCDEIEKFCKNSAVREAISSCLDEIAKNQYDNVTKKIEEAITISLEQDLGEEFYEDSEQKLKSFVDNLHCYPTGIKSLDDKLDGGLVRKQTTLFSANSGGGKSIMLTNIAYRYASQGMHVIYISLELSEPMVYVRNAAIATGMPIKHWKENIPEIAYKIDALKEGGAGSFLIKRMPNKTTRNSIRSYLKQYELKYKRKPDVIVVDYLDVMKSEASSRITAGWEQDKEKAADLYEIGVDYDAIMLTASQQNREAIRMSSPDQAVIAGGIGKIDVVDNYISIFMDVKMRIDGLMLAFFLKTRSNDSVGENLALKFDSSCLRISDAGSDQKMKSVLRDLDLKAKFKKRQMEELTANFDEAKEMSEDVIYKKNVDNNDTITGNAQSIESLDLAEFMQTINGTKK